MVIELKKLDALLPYLSLSLSTSAYPLHTYIHTQLAH